jgi:hypothetical protein
MPAKSAKQEKFMQAVANNPKFAKKVGVPVTVGKEFTKSGGGEMKESKKMVGKEIAFMKKKGAPKSMVKHEMAEAGMKKGGMAMKKMAGGGKTLGISPDMDVSDDKDEYKRSMRNQRAKDIGLAGVAGALSGAKLGALGLDYMGRRKTEKKDSVKENQKQYGMKKGGMAMKKMASGGLAGGHKAADGVAMKGKTKAKQVTMKKGGYC